MFQVAIWEPVEEQRPAYPYAGALTLDAARTGLAPTSQELWSSRRIESLGTDRKILQTTERYSNPKVQVEARLYFSSTVDGAPFSLTMNTRNFAGFVVLAFRLTV
jgi:hypothetical protein